MFKVLIDKTPDRIILLIIIIVSYAMMLIYLIKLDIKMH